MLLGEMLSGEMLLDWIGRDEVFELKWKSCAEGWIERQGPSVKDQAESSLWVAGSNRPRRVNASQVYRVSSVEHMHMWRAHALGVCACAPKAGEEAGGRGLEHWTLASVYSVSSPGFGPLWLASTCWSKRMPLT